LFDIAGLLQQAIDRLLANHGLTRGDVLRFKQDAERLLVEIKEMLPDLKVRFDAMEKALHTQTEALTILLNEKNKRDELERAMQISRTDDIAARAANGDPNAARFLRANGKEPN
jgi:hypothetical protein